MPGWPNTVALTERIGEWQRLSIVSSESQLLPIIALTSFLRFLLVESSNVERTLISLTIEMRESVEILREERTGKREKEKYLESESERKKEL